MSGRVASLPISTREVRHNLRLVKELRVTEHDPEPVSYVPGLRLRAVRFVDDNTLEYDFEGIDAADETFRLTRSKVDRLGIWLYNFDQDFVARYRAVPGVYGGTGLERLGAYFFAVRRSELPVGRSWERLKREIQARLAERWRQIHPDDPAGDSRGQGEGA